LYRRRYPSEAVQGGFHLSRKEGKKGYAALRGGEHDAKYQQQTELEPTARLRPIRPQSDYKIKPTRKRKKKTRWDTGNPRERRS